MSGSISVSEVIDRIYEGAIDPAAWQPALTSLCEAVGAHHAVSFARDTSRAGLPFAASARVDPQSLARFFEAFGGPIDWFSAFPIGNVFDFESVIPLNEFVRTPFYNDIIRPMGGYRALCAIPLRRPGIESYIALCRPENTDTFGPNEQAVMTAVLPHLSRALVVRLEMDMARDQARTALQAIERLDVPLVVVDADLQPILLSDSASAIVRHGDGLVQTRRGLSTGTVDQTRRLYALVQRAASDDPRAPGRYHMRLTRPESRSPWLVTVSSLKRDRGATISKPRVILLLEDGAARPVDAAATLMAMFELTPREAALAATLAQGHDLAKAADRLDIATATARSYLKSIFLKTGTHRQAELVALILRLDRFGG